VVAAWRDAVARADTIPAVRLLYEARISQGLARSSGTLAVRLAPDSVNATLSGPFGAALARYENGTLTGEGLRPIEIDPAALRALLSGVWREPGPVVAGIGSDAGRLRWEGPTRVDGVIDLSQTAFESLRIDRTEGSIAAAYSGARDPFPRKVDLEDLRTGSHMKLTLVGVEKL
jgi:hypothetical protein